MNIQKPSAADSSFVSDLIDAYPAMIHKARGLLPSPDAEDLVQDAIERALRSREQYRYGKSPEPWLAVILRRLFIDDRRRRRRRFFVPLELSERGEHGALAGGVPSDDPVWWESLQMDDLRGLVGELPPPLGRVFELRAFHRLTYASIGSRLGVPVGTVGTRFLRARRRLRHLLEVRHGPTAARLSA